MQLCTEILPGIESNIELSVTYIELMHNIKGSCDITNWSSVHGKQNGAKHLSLGNTKVKNFWFRDLVVNVDNLASV